MSFDQINIPKSFRLRLSLDVWAVIAAFLLAAFVRAGFLRHIPW